MDEDVEISKSYREPLPAYCLLALLVLLLYLSTLAPDVTLIDSGELITANYCLGNPHSPGYPTYTPLAHCFTYLPLGSIAYRYNLFSAACGVFCALLLAFMLKPLQLPLVHRFFAGALFAFSLTFWQQAIMTEVYCLFFIAAISILGIYFHTNSDHFWRSYSQRLFYLSSFIIGLSLGIHQQIVFIIPALALIVITLLRDYFFHLRKLFIHLFVFLLGFSTHIYLPIRAAQHPYYAWEDPQRSSSFFGLITTRTFNAQRFVRSYQQFSEHLANYKEAINDQFHWSVLILALVGILYVFYNQRRVYAYALIMIWAIDTIVGVTYFNLSSRWFNTLDVFFILGHLAIIILAAQGLTLVYAPVVLCIGIITKGRSRIELLRYSTAIIPAVIIIISFQANYPRIIPQGSYFVYDWGRSALMPLPPNSLLIANSDEVFVLWYLQGVNRLREDIGIVHNLTLGIRDNWSYLTAQRNYPWLLLHRIPPNEDAARFLAWRINVFTTYQDESLVDDGYSYYPWGFTNLLLPPNAHALEPHGNIFRRWEGIVLRDLPLQPSWRGSAEREYLAVVAAGAYNAYQAALKQVNHARASEFKSLYLSLIPPN